MSYEFSPDELDALKRHISTARVTSLGKFFYHVLSYRKKLVFKNLNQVFSHVLTAEEIERLAKAFYSHIAKTFFEILALPFMSQKRIKRNARLVNHKIGLDLLEKHKGLIILTGHFGNWEFGPIGGILNFKEFQGRLHFIRRNQSVQWIGKLLFRGYFKAGLRVITQKNSLPKVCEVLENNGVVVFVMDQHPPVGSKDGIMVDFLGRKAGTYRSIASIARYMKVPVIPATTYRDDDGQHVLEFFNPLEWISCDNSKEEIHVNTRVYNEAIEKLVLAHPEQWLWMYKRWKI